MDSSAEFDGYRAVKGVGGLLDNCKILHVLLMSRRVAARQHSCRGEIGNQNGGNTPPFISKGHAWGEKKKSVQTKQILRYLLCLLVGHIPETNGALAWVPARTICYTSIGGLKDFGNKEETVQSCNLVGVMGPRPDGLMRSENH